MGKRMVIAVAVITVILFFRGAADIIKAVTVSADDIKEQDYETGSDFQTVVLDSQTSDKASGSAVETDELESGEVNEAVSDDIGEAGQAVYLDKEFADSILNYLNVAYKVGLIQLILMALIAGAAITSVIMEWFTR